MPKPLVSEEDRDRMVAMSRCGKTRVEIRESYGLNVKQMEKLIRNYRLPIPQDRERLRTPAFIERVLTLRRDGKSTAKIARIVGCSDAHAANICSENGVYPTDWRAKLCGSFPDDAIPLQIKPWPADAPRFQDATQADLARDAGAGLRAVRRYETHVLRSSSAAEAVG